MDLPWSRGAKYAGCKTYAHYNRLKHSKELDVEFKRIATIYPFLTTNQLLSKAKKSVESQKQSAKKKNVAKQARKVYDYDSNEDFKQGKRRAKRAVAKFKWESDESSVDLDANFSQRKHSGFMDLDADDASKRRNRRYVPLTVEKTERKPRINKVTADKYKAALTNKQEDRKRNEKISYIKKKPVVIEVIELSSDSEGDWAGPPKQPERSPENDWKTVKIKTEKLDISHVKPIPLEESSPSSNEVLQSNYNKKRRVIESSSEGSTHSWNSHKVINKGPNKSADKAATLIAGVSDVQSRSVPETQVRQDATHSVSRAGFLCDLFD